MPPCERKTDRERETKSVSKVTRVTQLLPNILRCGRVEWNTVPWLHEEFPRGSRCCTWPGSAAPLSSRSAELGDQTRLLWRLLPPQLWQTATHRKHTLRFRRVIPFLLRPGHFSIFVLAAIMRPCKDLLNYELNLEYNSKYTSYYTIIVYFVL